MRVAFHFNPVYMAALSRGIDWFERNFNREIARDYIKMAQEEIDKEEPERRRKAEIKAKEDEEKAKINAKEDEEKAKIKAKKDEEKAKIKAKEDEEKERRMRLKKSNDMQLKILKAVIKERELKKYEKTMAYFVKTKYIAVRDAIASSSCFQR